MYDLIISHIDSNMTAVADDIARFFAAPAYLISCMSLFGGGTRQGKTKMCINGLCKAGAVRALCQAGSAASVRISDKFFRIFYNTLSGFIIS